MGGRGAKSGFASAGGKAADIGFCANLANDEDIKELLGESEHEWVNDLTEAEKDAINKYTDLYYVDMNSYLNGEKISQPSQTGQYINHVDRAISGFYLDHNIYTYRGDANPYFAQMSDDEFNSLSGKTYTSKQYISTSVINGKHFDNEPIQYITKTPAGKGVGAYIASVSEYRSEREFLLKRGTSFQIDKTYIIDGKRYIEQTIIN